jgi:hypothetical protein
MKALTGAIVALVGRHCCIVEIERWGFATEIHLTISTRNCLV